MTERGLTLFDLAPGKVLLDRYQIVRAHRHGGMSSTFEVTDQSDGERRELSVFPAALFEDRRQSADFAQRMEAWRAIPSANVLRVRGVEELRDGSLLLLTDFPPGCSLREWLNEHRRMELDEARGMGRKLLGGLTAIHAAGQVHGDIKPSTIHLSDGTPGGEPVLLDGGITPGLWSAKNLGDKTALIGTPFYAPIEQFGGESPDVQSDVYNVATVLYELTTGRLPWAGTSFLEVFQAKLAKTPPSMRERAPELDLPRGFEDVIRRGLLADRRERYQSAQAFLSALTPLGARERPAAMEG